MILKSTWELFTGSDSRSGPNFLILTFVLFYIYIYNFLKKIRHRKRMIVPWGIFFSEQIWFTIKFLFNLEVRSQLCVLHLKNFQHFNTEYILRYKSTKIVTIFVLRTSWAVSFGRFGPLWSTWNISNEGVNKLVSDADRQLQWFHQSFGFGSTVETASVELITSQGCSPVIDDCYGWLPVNEPVHKDIFFRRIYP